MAQTRRSAAIDDLKALIESQYAPGSRLPAEVKLAQTLGVSRNTLREAVGELVLSGLVERRWGNGTFVSARGGEFHLNLTEMDPLHRQIEAAGHVATIHKASAVTRPAGKVAEVLGLDADAEVWHVERMFAIDGVPAVLFIEDIPAVINGRQLDLSGMDDINAEVITILHRRANARIARMEGRLLAVTADEDLASRFGIDRGHPLMRSEKVGLTDKAQVVVASTNFYRTDVIAVHVASLVRTL